MDRDTIFISHASPDDNEFVRWLGGELTSRGYTVWADVFHLKGGTPFWITIEDALRKRAIKVIFVVSRCSVDPARSGVRNELSVADGLRKSLKDPGFIVPVRIDDTPFDELPIQVHQLNTLDFSVDRNDRLPELIETLEIGVVPRTGGNAHGVRSPAASGAAEPEKGAAGGAPPSIAVLPFASLSDDRQQEYFADGVVDDIIAALSRYKSFVVLARKTSFAFKGRDVNVREVARTLEADYVLEGSIRRAGERLRISAQLVAASSGATLWARNFDGKVDDVFDMQDGITASVAAAVEPEIHRAEVARSRRERPDSGASYDLYLKAMAKLDTLLPDDSRQGVMLLEKVIEVDPGFTKAVAMAAWAYEYRLHMGLEPIGPDDNGKCLKLARSALAVAGEDAVVIAHCGVILQLCAHEWEQGLRTIERAIALNPNNVGCQFFGGVGHLKGGSLDIAMSYFRRAIELNPADSVRALAGCGHVHACLGQYEEALDCGTRALAGDRNFGWIHWLVIISNAYLGRAEEAAHALALYRAIFPDAKLSRIRLGQAMKDASRAEVLPRGLLLAGMPED